MLDTQRGGGNVTVEAATGVRRPRGKGRQQPPEPEGAKDTCPPRAPADAWESGARTEVIPDYPGAP